MKRLVLMRHAKSSWAVEGQRDIDRPLNDRGKAAAPAMARWLEGQGALPDVILCSPSKRTRQTVKRMRTAVPGLPEPEIVQSLYLAEPAVILGAVRAAPETAATVMVVAHEPGISTTAHMLAGQGGPVPVPDQFPTAAVGVFELIAEGEEWGRLGWGGARLVAFARPRDLGD